MGREGEGLTRIIAGETLTRLAFARHPLPAMRERARRQKRRLGAARSAGDSGAMDDAMRVFDRTVVRRHRERAAAGLAGHDFLLREAGERLADRLDDMTRRFPLALDLGCHDGGLAEQIGARGGIERLVRCDLSPAMAGRAVGRGRPGEALVADEELLPFGAAQLRSGAEQSQPALGQRSAGLPAPDRPRPQAGRAVPRRPPGRQRPSPSCARRCSRPSSSLNGGASPRVSPFADLRRRRRAAAARRLRPAGRRRRSLTVTYEDPFGLMAELRGMGETNATLARGRRFTSRRLLLDAASRYRAQFADRDGRVRASFQILYLTGWAPHESQQQALRPGSARSRLAEALDTVERPAGDKARPG